MAASQASRSRVSGSGGCPSSSRLLGRGLRLAQTRQLLLRDRLRNVLEIAVRDECYPLDLQALDEGRDLARLLGHGAARVDDPGKEQLVEPGREGFGVRRVEVDPEPVHGQLGNAP